MVYFTKGDMIGIKIKPGNSAPGAGQIYVKIDAANIIKHRNLELR